MAYYWRARHIPELRAAPPSDRAEWLHVARQRSTRWPARVAMVLTSAVSWMVAHEWSRREQWNLPASLLAVVVAVGAAALILDAVWLQPRARRWLRQHLHEFRADEGHAEAAGGTWR